MVVPSVEAASTTSSANITRDNSPPDALLFSGSTEARSWVPRCAVKPNSTASTPSVPACTSSPDGSFSGALSSLRAGMVVTATVKSASAIARPPSSAVTDLASPVAALVRLLDSSVAQAATCVASSSTRRDNPLSASSETSRAASRCRDSDAQANTPSTSAAYLRIRVRSSPWRASLVSNELASSGRAARKSPSSRPTSPTTLSTSVSWRPRALRAASSADSSCVIARARMSVAEPFWLSTASSSAPDSAARAPTAASRTTSSSESRRISATSDSSSPGLGSTPSISVSANFSRSASCAISRARLVRSTRSRRAISHSSRSFR